MDLPLLFWLHRRRLFIGAHGCFLLAVSPPQEFSTSYHIMKAKALALLAFFPFVVAIPTSLSKRQDETKYCGQWDTATEGNYELLLDQWGISGATGSQCAQVTSLSGSDIAWTTTWTWSGGSGVKSFTNIQLNEGVNVPLSSISSMPVRI